MLSFMICCVTLGVLCLVPFAQAALSDTMLSPSPTAFDAGHFLRSLDSLCDLLNRLSPVTDITEKEGWYVLTLRPGSMQAPTARSLDVAAARSVDIQLLSGPCTMCEEMQVPGALYHGTSPQSLLLILLEGRFACAGNLGMHRHTPDGLYSYLCPTVSAKSWYVEQGCQIKFKAACFAISRNNSRLVEVVPEGVACRMYRSEKKNLAKTESSGLLIRAPAKS
jgi:hypothetical protein